MKHAIFLFVLFSVQAQAQINLDHPVPTGVSDEIYTAVDNKDLYYFIPTQLCRLNEPDLTYDSGRLFAEFKVGVCPLEVEQIKKKLTDYGIANPNVRILRGINAAVSKMSLTPMFSNLDPKIEILGDAGDLAGPITYRISMVSGFRRRPQNRAWNAMTRLFGESAIDAYIQVEYQFSSVLGGVPKEANSAAAVYVAKKYPSAISKPLSTSTEILFHESTRIQLDSVTHCWTQPVPGVICIK